MALSTRPATSAAVAPTASKIKPTPNINGLSLFAANGVIIAPRFVIHWLASTPPEKLRWLPASEKAQYGPDPAEMLYAMKKKRPTMKPASGCIILETKT